MSEINLPASIQHLFAAAGWKPGRRVVVPRKEFGGLPIFPTAEAVLAEFAHLHVGTTGRGQDHSRSDIRFDPVHIDEDEDSVAAFQARIDTRLFPLGSAHHEHMTLFIDEVGLIYSLDLPVGEFWLVDLNFALAMESLLLGLRRDGADIRGLMQIHPYPMQAGGPSSL